VKVKFGIKVGMLFSSLVMALGCFVGCNSDEPAATPPAGGTSKPDMKAPPAAKPDDVKK
jgi:hypothetical protein